jgi:hypothetical protein
MRSSTWRDRLGIDDPAQCLIAAIISLAIRDAAKGPPAVVADARVYLTGRNFEVDCAALDLDPAAIRGRLNLPGHQEAP